MPFARALLFCCIFSWLTATVRANLVLTISGDIEHRTGNPVTFGPGGLDGGGLVLTATFADGAIWEPLSFGPYYATPFPTH